MRVVERPVCRPMRCAAMPHIGQMTRTRWVDTGSEMHGPDDHVYLSEVAITEGAKLFGWVAPGTVKLLHEQVADLHATIAALEERCEHMERAWQAVDVIESQGFTARKKPGRPAKEAVT